MLIEDAAEAIGGFWKEKSRINRFITFSFHGTKTITCGEAVDSTDDKELYETIVCLNNHGRKIGEKRQFYSEVGFKFKMSNVQAAIGCAQLSRCNNNRK